MLCRVFHKAKTENNSDQYIDDFLPGGATSPTLATSPPPDNSSFTARDYHHNISAFSATHNPPQKTEISKSQLLSPPPIDQITPISKCEEEPYGFLFDLSFGETNLKDHNGVSVDLEEMQFDDDNGMIFF